MLGSFLLNIFLALVWTFLQGELHASNFAIGLVLGYLVIGVSQRILGNVAYVLKVLQVFGFVIFVLWEIFTASLALAWIIVQPRLQLRPAVVAIPLDADTDLEIATLANLLTLSPGTLSLDVSTDARTLYVHTMVLDDPDEFRREIKEKMERRVLEVMR
jgi:multicomponent Na+:H+ antiporter subunit E